MPQSLGYLSLPLTRLSSVHDPAPATSRVTSVTQKELSEARKRVASATSSAQPNLSSTFLDAPFREGRSGRNRARKRGCRVLRKERHRQNWVVSGGRRSQTLIVFRRPYSYRNAPAG